LELSFLLVALVAFCTPMLLNRLKISLIPTSIAEIIVGIILGKSGFNIIHIDSLLNYMSTFGVIILLFLSGMEIDFSLFKKNAGPVTPLALKRAQNQPTTSADQVAIIAYGATLVTSVILAYLLKLSGLFSDLFLAVILFSTIALGIVISVLKENELLSKPLGQALLLIAVLGEVIPLLSLTIYSSLVAGRGGSIWLISLLFIAGALIFKHFQWFFKDLNTLNKATTQIDIRLAFAIIIALVLLAEAVGAENILGAFVAGIVLKLLQPATSTQHKLDALGYGFFIPYFFILTGVKLDIPSLLSSPKTLVLIPIFFICFILAKMTTYFGLRLRFKEKNALAGAFLSSTTITLVLAVLTVAENLKVINAQQSGAFLIAGILTCIVGPLLFNKLTQPEPEDLQKTTVHILGVNLVTVNVLKRLTADWYDIKMYTDSKKNYTTYNHIGNINFLESLEPDDLISQQVFDADIMVFGYSKPEINFKLALAAKEYGVERVITSIENSDPVSMSQMDKTLKKAGIEYFSAFDTSVGIMSAIIETPSTLELLTGSAHLYEVIVNNAKFAGLEVKDLPFIQHITISRIFREGKPIAPHGDTQIQLGDHIVFSADRSIVNTVRQTISKLND
jgi:CPA2 family monovalent cation:H+ antiporter-2